MAKQPVTVPDLGDFDAVDVVEVLVTAGDRLEVDDPLISLESDKATMDVPSPHAGTVREVKVKAGDQVKQGDLILMMEVEEEAPEKEEPAAKEKPEAEGEADDSPAEAAPAGEDKAPADDRPQAEPAAGDGTAADDGDRRQLTDEQRRAAVHSPAPVDEYDYSHVYASPAVRRFARLLGVDLQRVQGTGRKNRILKEDVEGFVKKAMSEPESARGGAALPEMPVIDFSRFGEVERKPLTRIQRISGPNLQRSWLHVPHVTQHDEADITELEAFRQQHKAEAKQKGFALTPLAFLIRATVRALQEFPVVNSSLDPDGEHLVLKRYYHLGIAVDTPDGLVVPVIRDADQKGIMELAEELADLSARTREGKLKMDELRGASFTISSLGGIGGTAFTPIVNAPEVGILGVARHRMTPVWNGESFEPRLMLPFALSYDHRVIDGALAVRFTTFLGRLLSDIRQLLL